MRVDEWQKDETEEPDAHGEELDAHVNQRASGWCPGAGCGLCAQIMTASARELVELALALRGTCQRQVEDHQQCLHHQEIQHQYQHQIIVRPTKS